MTNIGPFLEKALTNNQLEVLRIAGRLVEFKMHERIRSAHLVGGPVRDALLGIQPTDIDILVEGDAVRMAEALVESFGGEVLGRSEFRTAKARIRSMVVDVVTARRETYAHPGALPEVAPASIDEDLKRRDFTVNAMAVDVTPSGWGELIEQPGAQRDLMMHKLRVFHERSFSDDPTRILRGLRYEQRLKFTFEPKTLQYLKRDVGILGRVSGARIAAELEKIFRETAPGTILQIAEERGVLASIDPAFRVPSRATAVMDAPPEDLGDDRCVFMWALIGSSLTDTEARALVQRLEPPKEIAALLQAGPRFRAIAAVLERGDLRPSEAHELLSPFPLVAVKAQLALAPPTQQRETLRSWLQEWRFRKSSLTGDDLLNEGVPQGPIVGRLLDELQRAELDRTVRSREDELAYVKRRLPVLLGQS